MVKSALVVDDEPSMREIVAFLLEDAGYEVRLACSGPEALEVVAGWIPTAAVVDYMMPEMDGFELSQKLQVACPGVHIVMTTANGSRPPNRERLDALGIAHYVTKPFTKAELLQAVGSGG